MHFKFETKALDDVLSRISKVIPSVENVQFVGKDKKVRVMATHEGFSVSVHLPCDLMEEGKFAAVFADVKKLFRNRKEIEMKVAGKGNKVMFKAGSSKDFSGDIVCMEYTSIKFDSKDDKAVKLAKDQAEFICTAIPLLNIEDFYFKKPPSLTVHFTEKGGYCFVNSDFHMGVARVKGKFKDTTLTLPLKNFVSIVQLSGKEAFSIAVSESSIQITSKEFDAIFPLESQEDRNIKQTFKMIDSILKQEEIAKVDMQELKDSMDNISAVHDDKSAMKVILDKKEGMVLSLEALRGSVKSKLKNAKVMKTVPEFSVTPQIVANILKNAKKGVFILRTSDRLFSLSSKGDGVSYHYIGTFFE